MEVNEEQENITQIVKIHLNVNSTEAEVESCKKQEKDKKSSKILSKINWMVMNMNCDYNKSSSPLI